MRFNDRLGEKNIGQVPGTDDVNFLLCLRGDSEGPKVFKRFMYVDDPCRQLSYISDEEAHDAISFVPKKNIQFAGFSVYPVMSTEADFKCIYKYKIGGATSQETAVEFGR